MSLDALVTELDARYRSWDLYRLIGRTGWAVVLRETADGQLCGEGVVGHAVHADTIEGALKAALEDFAPPVPPKPSRCWPDEFSVRKDGSSWRLERHGGFVCRFPRKRDAEAAIGRYVEASAGRVRAWEAKHGAPGREP